MKEVIDTLDLVFNVMGLTYTAYLLWPKKEKTEITNEDLVILLFLILL